MFEAYSIPGIHHWRQSSRCRLLVFSENLFHQGFRHGQVVLILFQPCPIVLFDLRRPLVANRRSIRLQSKVVGNINVTRLQHVHRPCVRAALAMVLHTLLFNHLLDIGTPRHPRRRQCPAHRHLVGMDRVPTRSARPHNRDMIPNPSCMHSTGVPQANVCSPDLYDRQVGDNVKAGALKVAEITKPIYEMSIGVF